MLHKNFIIALYVSSLCYVAYYMYLNIWAPVTGVLLYFCPSPLVMIIPILFWFLILIRKRISSLYLHHIHKHFFAEMCNMVQYRGPASETAYSRYKAMGSNFLLILWCGHSSNIQGVTKLVGMIEETKTNVFCEMTMGLKLITECKNQKLYCKELLIL